MSILGPLLFNTSATSFLKNMNVILPATLMIIHLRYMTQIQTVLRKLKKCTDSLFIWFKENHTKPNGDKCRLFVTTEKSDTTNIDGNNIKNKKNKAYLVQIRIHLYLSEVTLQVS